MNPSRFHPARLPSWASSLLALLAGAVLVLAYAPFDLGWVAPLALAMLFALWLHAGRRQAAWRGWWFGVGLFGGGVYWVYFSMHVYGNLPPLLAGLFTAVMALLLALFTALTGWLAGLGTQRVVLPRLLLVFPALWVLLEWVRSWLFTGFPWLFLGYTQLQLPPGQLAPVLGVYGVGLAVVVSAALLVAVLQPGPRRGRVLGAIALALLWAASWSVSLLDWTRPAGPPVQVTLLQPNVAQNRKWDPDYSMMILGRNAAMTREHWDSDLIVWPETALPVFYDQVSDTYLRVLEAEARAHGTDLLIGLPVREAEGVYYNSMLSLGAEQAFYHKRHLVPFGEYIPFRAWLGTLLDILQVPMSNFSRGAQGQAPLPVAGHRAGVSICYEIAFPGEVRDFLPAAAWLVNVSNNTWFGDSSAPHQVLQMAQMRALETGRFVLSATNDGVTAVVDQRGRIQARAPQFQATTLTAALVPFAGATPYVRFGDGPALLLAGMMLLSGWWRVWKLPRNGPATQRG